MFRCLVLALAAFAFSTPSLAQAQRNFPREALRGTLLVDKPPDVKLNDAPARLGAGARIRGQDNLLKVTGALIGSTWVVNYTVDTQGLIKDVWLLNADEAAKRPWPVTPQQAQEWQFDPVAQTWSKP